MVFRNHLTFQSHFSFGFSQSSMILTIQSNERRYWKIPTTLIVKLHSQSNKWQKRRTKLAKIVRSFKFCPLNMCLIKFIYLNLIRDVGRILQTETAFLVCKPFGIWTLDIKSQALMRSFLARTFNSQNASFLIMFHARQFFLLHENNLIINVGQNGQRVIAALVLLLISF